MRMLDSMRGRQAPDLEETMRQPLALTCCLPQARRTSLEAEDAATGYIDERPQRVIVRPVVGSAPKAKVSKAAVTPLPRPRLKALKEVPAWRPERKRPVGRPVPQPAIKRKVSPRANTVPSQRGELSMSSLAMFWGMSLAGSLVAIGIALTAW
jgi:hypothetical protein